MILRLLILISVVALSTTGCSKKPQKSLALDNKGIALGNAFIPPTLYEARSLEGHAVQDVPNDSSQAESSKHNPKLGYKNKEKRAHLVRNQEQEARLLDIPIPLSASALSEYKQDNSACAMYYTCEQTADSTISFYTSEMERAGWLLEAVFSQGETLLTFVKPQRFCTIIVRPFKQKHEEQVDISVYTGMLQS